MDKPAIVLCDKLYMVSEADALTHLESLYLRWLDVVRLTNRYRHFGVVVSKDTSSIFNGALGALQDLDTAQQAISACDLGDRLPPFQVAKVSGELLRIVLSAHRASVGDCGRCHEGVAVALGVVCCGANSSLKGGGGHQVIANPDELDPELRLDPRSIWSEGGDVRDLMYGLYLHARSVDPSCRYLRVAMNSGFHESARMNQCLKSGEYASVCMQKASRIALGLESGGAHWISPGGSGKKARQHQVARDDGALGYRAHVTKKGVGLRIEYWDKAGRRCLANVGPKHELMIEGKKSVDEVAVEYAIDGP